MAHGLLPPGSSTACACLARAATSIVSDARLRAMSRALPRVAVGPQPGAEPGEGSGFPRLLAPEQAIHLPDEFLVGGKRAPLACNVNVGLLGARIAGQLGQTFAFAGPIQA